MNEFIISKCVKKIIVSYLYEFLMLRIIHAFLFSVNFNYFFSVDSITSFFDYLCLSLSHNLQSIKQASTQRYHRWTTNLNKASRNATRLPPRPHPTPFVGRGMGARR